MKVAISVPNDLFDEAEELVTELSLPRSQFYSDALRGHVRKFRDEKLTEQINSVLDELGQENDLKFVRRASADVNKHSEW